MSLRCGIKIVFASFWEGEKLSEAEQDEYMGEVLAQKRIVHKLELQFLKEVSFPPRNPLLIFVALLFPDALDFRALECVQEYKTYSCNNLRQQDI